MDQKANDVEEKVFQVQYKDELIPVSEKNVIEWFHQIYYAKAKETWENTTWLGMPVLKCPLDLWVYQEIIIRFQPDLIIETGTLDGTSALYYAILCAITTKGEVVTIDINKKEGLVKHPRIKYLTGSSTSPGIKLQVEELCKEKKRVVVFLDSDHSKEHVLEELAFYSTVVTPGSYLIVEGTNSNGHPVNHDAGPGPMEAIDEFLANNDSFMIDESKEKFMMSFNPRGYLRRIK